MKCCTLAASTRCTLHTGRRTPGHDQSMNHKKVAHTSSAPSARRLSAQGSASSDKVCHSGWLSSAMHHNASSKATVRGASDQPDHQREARCKRTGHAHWGNKEAEI